MYQRKIGAGIIGTGSIAQKHVAGMLKSGLFDLRGVVSRSNEAYSRFCTVLNLEHARFYDTIEHMLEDKNIEVVDICTPNRYHAAAAIAALRAAASARSTQVSSGPTMWRLRIPVRSRIH